MIVIKVKLDTRTKKKDGSNAIRFYISNNRETTTISTRYSAKVSEFIGNEHTCKFVKSTAHDAEEINKFLATKLMEYRQKANLIEYRASDMTANEVKEALLDVNLIDKTKLSFIEFAEQQLEKYYNYLEILDS